MSKKISFKLNLIIHILLLVLVMSSALIATNYYFGKKLALAESTQDMLEITQAIARHEKISVKHNKGTLDTLAAYPNLLNYKTANSPLKTFSLKKFEPVFYELMENNLDAYAIYVANDSGDYFELINMLYDEVLLDAMEAPSNSRWAEISVRSVEPNTKKIRFYDINNTLILERSEVTQFVPQNRPWYTKAIAANTVIRTAPYQFQHLKKMGFSYAKHLPSISAVAGIDYTSHRTHELLEELKPTPKSIITVIDNKLNLLEASNDNTEHFLVYLNNHNQAPSQLEKRFIDGEYYWIMGTMVKGARDFHVVLFTPEEEIIAPHLEQVTLSAWVVLITTLLALPFIWLLSLAITKPIQQLIDENKKIQRRNYKDVGRIPTIIKELDDLSGSMLSMSSSIQNYQQSQADLLNSIIRLIADAIDAKSPYTGGHCQRVPLLAMMLVDEASKDNGNFSAFKFDDEDERRAFEIGAWLHDCGKVTTPEYVVDKATKLETIYNRIHEIRTRFEVLWRDADIAYYQAIINGENKETAQNKRTELHKNLQDDFSFIASTNAGGEYLGEDKIQRIREIAKKTWLRHFDSRLGLSQEELERVGSVSEQLPVTEPLLADKAFHKIAREHFNFEDYQAQGFKEPVPELLYDQGELLNLTISKGTLTNEERFKIKEHIIMTIKMLENVPFPEEYKNVPRYAGTHHETLKGTGYPRQLTADDLSIPEKIMVIADIFEALTASDRPYKEAKTLSQSIKIMSFMVKDQHIDAALFNLFLQSGTYLKYAEQFLKPEQIDEVDVDAYL